MCSMEDVRVSCQNAKMYILYVRIHIRSLYKIVNSVTVHNSVNYSGLIPVQNLPSKALTCRMKTLQILKQKELHAVTFTTIIFYARVDFFNYWQGEA